MFAKYSLRFLLLALLLSVAIACAAPASDGGSAGGDAAADQEAPAPDPAEAAASADEAMEGGYKIGVVVAETGGASSLGLPEANTARMVAAQLMESGGVADPSGTMHPVEVIIYDSETNPDTAAAAISRLILEDEVDVIVAGSTSGNSMAMAPIAAENGVAMISMGSAGVIVKDPETGEARKWIFKTPLINDHAGLWHMEYFAAQGISDICYLYENTGYGQDFLNTGLKAAEAKGINVVYQDAFERSDTEFPQLASVESSGCEAVVVGSLVPGAVNVSGAIKDFLGEEIVVMQGGGMCNSAFLTLDPSAVEGTVANCPKLLVDVDVLPDSDPQKEILIQYRDEYEAFTGESVDSFGGHAYDAFVWAAAGLSSLEDGMSLQERRAMVRDTMENDFKDVPLTSGVFSPSPDDHLGTTFATSATLVRVEDGQFIYYDQSEWGGNLDLDN